MAEEWVVVEKVAGSLQAEFLRGFLESQGISVVLSQEGVGSVFPVTVGPLSQVQILVSKSDAPQAKKILDDYYTGNLEDQVQLDE
jgi:hypothetical protein